MDWNQEIRTFFQIFLGPTRRRVNIVLLGIFFVLLPPQNAYSNWQIPTGESLTREVDGISISSLEVYPINVTGKQLPWLTARSLIVVDVDSKAVLFSKEPDWQLYPASTTKMMTALVTLEAYDLDQVITIERNGAIGQTMRLEPGEQITVENLLYGLLVGSGNDAAEVLARHYPGGEVAFIERMNQKAQELHLNQTQFRNASGIEAFGHISTVHDLVLLGAELMKHPLLARMVGTSTITVADVSGKMSHELTNINQLVVDQVPGVLGIKTGWTEHAGECLVTYVEREGHRLIVAMLGSADRFGETEAVVNWAFANHDWQEMELN